MKNKAIYLDYAAATPMDPAVLEAMQSYFIDDFYNPSADYLAARAVKKLLNEARAKVARILGAKPAEIVFTSGATEANNTAIQGVMKYFPDGEVLISAVEHDSVRQPARLHACHELPVNRYAIAEPFALERFISDDTVLVSIGLVNNEIGTIQPLKEISGVIEKIRTDRQKKGNKNPLYLHTDAAQAGCYLPLNAPKLGIDLMSINGGKIYGPKQSGALYIKTGTAISPLIGGGGQEHGMRAGTENVPGVIGFAAALEQAQRLRSDENKRLSGLRQMFVSELSSIADATVNGSMKNTAPHIISVTFAGKDNERLMMQLDEAGIQCATGSACHASNTAPSHVLAAIGLTKKQARSTLRFSLGRYSDIKQLQKTLEILGRLTGANR